MTSFDSPNVVNVPGGQVPMDIDTVAETPVSVAQHPPTHADSEVMDIATAHFSQPDTVEMDTLRHIYETQVQEIKVAIAASPVDDDLKAKWTSMAESQLVIRGRSPEGEYTPQEICAGLDKATKNLENMQSGIRLACKLLERPEKLSPDMQSLIERLGFASVQPDWEGVDYTHLAILDIEAMTELEQKLRVDRPPEISQLIQAGKYGSSDPLLKSYQTKLQILDMEKHTESALRAQEIDLSRPSGLDDMMERLDIDKSHPDYRNYTNRLKIVQQELYSDGLVKRPEPIDAWLRGADGIEAKVLQNYFDTLIAHACVRMRQEEPPGRELPKVILFSPNTLSGVVNLTEERKEVARGGTATIYQVAARIFPEAGKGKMIPTTYILKVPLQGYEEMVGQELQVYQQLYSRLTPEEKKYFVALIGDRSNPTGLSHYLMEHIHGPDMFDSVKDDTLTPEAKANFPEHVSIIGEILAKYGYLLGDIKLENFLVDGHFPVLIDFGGLYSYKEALENPTPENIERLAQLIFTAEAIPLCEYFNNVTLPLVELYRNLKVLPPDAIRAHLNSILSNFAKMQEFTMGLAIFQAYCGLPPFNTFPFPQEDELRSLHEIATGIPPSVELRTLNLNAPNCDILKELELSKCPKNVAEVVKDWLTLPQHMRYHR